MPICHLGRVVERVPGLGRLGDELLGRLWQTYLQFLLRAFSRIIPFILEDARPRRDATTSSPANAKTNILVLWDQPCRMCGSWLIPHGVR